MRLLLLMLGLLVAWSGRPRAEDDGGGAGPHFRPVRPPEAIFETPNVNLTDPPPAPPVLPVAPAPEPTPEAAAEAVILPPEPAALGPAVPLEGEAEPRPFNFQLVNGGTTWIPGDGDRLGIFSLSGPGTVAFKTPEQFTGTLGAGFHFLDGPHRTDLPSKLFEVSFALGWRNQIDDQWAFEAVVAPGVYADFEGTARDGVRILGHGIVWYQPSPENLWAFGVTSLDRETVAVLPVFGVVHRPNEQTRLELLFPRPRLAWRIGPAAASWVYLAGEYGGGSWAIERSTDEDDVLTLNDLRLIVGVELLGDEFPYSFFEVGYVFGREVRYRSGRGNYDPDDALMLRMGSHF